jgi:hypothetical protein
VSWVVAVVGYHYPKHQNHWGYCVSVWPSENWVFIKHTFISLLIKLTSTTCMTKTRSW